MGFDKNKNGQTKSNLNLSTLVHRSVLFSNHFQRHDISFHQRLLPRICNLVYSGACEKKGSSKKRIAHNRP